MENTFEEIYNYIKPISDLLEIWDKDLYWGGDAQQSAILKDSSYLISGILPAGNCAQCLIDCANRVVRWKKKYEEDLNKEQLNIDEQIKLANNLANKLILTKKNKLKK